MKITITKYVDHSEVHVTDNGQLLHAYTFDDHKQATAFCSGFFCGKNVANSLIQSMPMGYETKNSPETPETIGEQLSHQWVGSV